MTFTTKSPDEKIIDIKPHEKKFKSIGTQTENDFSSTGLALRSLGFYPEFSFKEKLLIVLGVSLFSGSAFQLTEKVSNGFFKFFAEENEHTQNLSNFACFIYFIISIIALKTAGNALHHFKHYSEQVDRQGEELIELKKQAK